MLGADVIGMSSVPEVIVAKYLGLKVAMVSVIVNMGAGMSNALLYMLIRWKWLSSQM